MSIPLEIERKFLIRRLPDGFDGTKGEAVQQGYIVAEPDVEVRIRAMAGRFWQTVKRGRGLQREEVELLLSGEQFARLKPLTKGQRIEKTRHALTVSGAAVVLDVYQGELAGLMIAEVESASVADSDAFSPPDWFGPELTEDERYKNKNLALKGLPSP